MRWWALEEMGGMNRVVNVEQCMLWGLPIDIICAEILVEVNIPLTISKNTCHIP